MTNPVKVIAKAIAKGLDANGKTFLTDEEAQPIARTALLALEAEGIRLVRIEEKPGVILVYDRDGDQIIAHYT